MGEVSGDLADASTLLQTTAGGIYGDTEETNGTFTVPVTPPKKKRSKCRERGSSRSRRESSEDSQPEDKVKEHPSSRRNSETSQEETKLKDNLETIRKKMADLQRLYEEELKQLKEE